MKMWGFNSYPTGGSAGPKNGKQRSLPVASECSDDEVSSNLSAEEELECPICYESFNMVENVPYVLLCGHTLCKNCVLGLQRAVVKLSTLPIHLPLFISCPWCHLPSFRLVYKGNLMFPRKNFFLLWMVEGMNGDRAISHSFCSYQQPEWLPNGVSTSGYLNVRRACLHEEQPHPHVSSNDGTISPVILNLDRIHASLRNSLVFFVHLTSKFPLVIIFLLIVLYAIPASAAILVLYIVITILFALPSFLVLYFAYPSLEWLVREIISQ